jgi:hypothetical protein
MRLIDLSHPLVDCAPAFPNDPKLAVIEFGSLATHKYNITQILMDTHQGIHLDAMFHFFEETLSMNRDLGRTRKSKIKSNLKDDPDYDRSWGSMTPMNRTARPKEMIGPAVFLASDESSYMTGQVFYVD